MASAADRFTRLQKIAVFLIAMGEERAREILADMDLETIERINDAMGDLGDITPKEKAAVMIEFGDFFYKNKPLTSKLEDASPKKTVKKKKAAPVQKASGKKVQQDAAKGSPMAVGPGKGGQPAKPKKQAAPSEEQAASEALDTLKKQASKIDWSKAGYDFGDGFKGGSERRR